MKVKMRSDMKSAAPDSEVTDLPGFGVNPHALVV
jgi:hypothetical protein